MITKFNLQKQTDFTAVNKTLQEDGVVVIENFLEAKPCSVIAKILDGEQKTNSNELTFININDAKFLSNPIGVCNQASDLVTKNEVFSIA